MHWAGPNFVIMIIAVCTVGWLVNNWIRAKHGYPLEDEWGGKTEHPALPHQRQMTLLSNENADLKGKIVHLEERVAVLERIATDSGTRLAEEIDALR
jgi:hypothetical protein